MTSQHICCMCRAPFTHSLFFLFLSSLNICVLSSVLPGFPSRPWGETLGSDNNRRDCNSSEPQSHIPFPFLVSKPFRSADPGRGFAPLPHWLRKSRKRRMRKSEIQGETQTEGGMHLERIHFLCTSQSAYNAYLRICTYNPQR